MCSLFFLQIFNHVVAAFKGVFKNAPEVIIEGRITTRGHIVYFYTALESTAVVVIEIKFQIRGDQEHLRAVAQVIAKCDGKPNN